MKTWSVIGLLFTAAILATIPISPQVTQLGVELSVDQAQAVTYGRYRRVTRRAYRRAGYAAAAGYTATAAGYGYGGVGYGYGGYGYGSAPYGYGGPGNAYAAAGYGPGGAGYGAGLRIPRRTRGPRKVVRGVSERLPVVLDATLASDCALYLEPALTTKQNPAVTVRGSWGRGGYAPLHARSCPARV